MGAAVSRILALDPGNTYTGWALIDATTCEPIDHGKTDNDTLLAKIYLGEHTDPSLIADHYAIEMIASYGMSVGAEVFETCVWIGRFTEAIATHPRHLRPELVKRIPVKVHHCHTAQANDANVRRAVADRFAYGQPNFGKGTKKDPGWFYGFNNDVWSAYELAVYVADRVEGRQS